MLMGFFQIYDMGFFHLTKDIRFHKGRPAPGLVSKVRSSFK
jgi:hypothetical protein